MISSPRCELINENYTAAATACDNNRKGFALTNFFCMMFLFGLSLLIVPSGSNSLKAMEKPVVLATTLGAPGGIYKCFESCIERHFTIVPYERFVQRKEQFAARIQALFVWGTSIKVDRELLQSLPNLKAVVNGGVGVDHLDIPLINSFGVKVSNTPHVVDNATADIGMCLMLASARRIVEGKIGDIWSENEEKSVGATYCVSMDELLQKSDFIMVVVNLSPQTHKLIGAKEFAMMKPNSTFINISRGLVVDQDALVEALQKKMIRAAALDVTYPEPLPRDHSLLSMPNVIVLPHVGTHTMETSQLMVKRMVTNALAALTGDQLPDEVKA
ncbi:hypothetical protein DNTS_021603 [Danionella cerebrum]|uniref:D-isomer specific 2-hydroxyacid dehydrogenase NAD-binding domain-containing protein n=1 Tax=Danionella cerebrum TaxID=2873325 RepID=A0A553QXL6_9TELE|nr:hypothetical protein DNTS_021603 [Danionella translucida]